jgi:ferrochelatase
MASTNAPPVGVLLLQLGTPDAPTPGAVRRYLRPFLSDPRVIEVPRPIWFLILNLFILPLRAPASARKYARIWSSQHGSPLRHYTARQAELVAKELGEPFLVAYGMRYGRPSVREALDDLLVRGCDRVVAVPLYPQ